nr:MAG TPA: Minor structural protein 4 [Caudoviricetes sp.]
MVGSSIEYKKLGLFTFERPEINDGQYRYKGYDRMMYKFNMLYSTALTGAHKTSEYMAEIARLTGVPFVSALEDITITMLPGYTYREVIGYIAALHGANAIINDEGNLEFRWYTQCDYSPAHIYMGGITYGMTDDYTLNMIKCTVTTQTDSGSEDVTYTSGTGSTGISINNPFMTQALLDSIYAKIGGLVYRPMTVSFSGDVLPELGDIVKVVDSGRTYKCPIMQMSHDYDGGIKTEIVSVGSVSESTKDTSGPLTKAMERYYADLVLINEAFVTKLTAQEAKIDKLDAEKITVSYLDAHYANLQLTNIEAGSIKTAMIATGAIKTAQIADGSITDAKIVSLTANKLSAGTIDASKIEVTNLNCANLTVGTINGQQIASGAVDMSKLGSDMTSWITSTDSGVNKALADAGIANTNATAAKNTADSASTTATAASKKADTAQSTADSASSAAASAGTKADNALSVANGITVGGRNLLHKYLRAGHNTSKIDDLSIKIGAVNSTDTYFYLKICTALEKGQTYTLSCEASNVPDGCDWYFGITSQTSIWQIHINKNGKCYATTTLNININAESEIIVDDISGRPSSAVNIILKNFKLEKGNKATDWTPAPEDVDKSIANAVSIANGKNTAYYQTSQPTGGTYKVNDNWFDTDDGYRMYYWNGSKWMATEYGASAIAANAITADKIAASAITAGKIAAGAITADKIAANAVTTNKIAANAITAGQIAAGTITATQIASKTIMADNLHADCITSEKIVAGAITADKIASNAITANKIAASAVTADKLSVTSLSAITADLGAITSGSINIGAGNFVVDTAGNLTSKGTMSIGNGGITYTSTNGLSVTGSIVAKNMTIYDKIALIDSGQKQNRMFAHYGSGDTINSLIIGDGNATVDINAGLVAYYGASINGILYPNGGIASTTILPQNSSSEGGELVLSAAPSTGRPANLDVNAQYFRVHSLGVCYMSLNLANGELSTGGIVTAGSVACKQVIPLYDCASGYACGNSSHRWNNVYSRTATINTSDRNEKHDIDYDFDVEIFKSLKPCTYMYNVGDRIHYGFIAQDVEQLMMDNDLDYKDFGFLCRDIKMRSVRNANGEETEVELLNADGTYQYTYGLRYEEMIAINTRMIQKEISRADEHEKKIRELERMIYNLQFELAKLQA